MASRRRRPSLSPSMTEPTHPIVSATLQGTGPRWCQGPPTFTLNPAHAATGVTPPIHIESSASSVTEGQTLDLDCVVAGQGQATITWYKRGGALPAKHQVGGDTGGVGDGGGCAWLGDATTFCHDVPRFQGPGCGCHSSRWPIRESTCAELTRAASPARPLSLSLSPPVTAPATVSATTG